MYTIHVLFPFDIDTGYSIDSSTKLLLLTIHGPCKVHSDITQRTYQQCKENNVEHQSNKDENFEDCMVNKVM